MNPVKVSLWSWPDNQKCIECINGAFLAVTEQTLDIFSVCMKNCDSQENDCRGNYQPTEEVNLMDLQNQICGSLNQIYGKDKL